MTEPSHGTRATLRLGWRSGLTAWLDYAVVECLFVSSLPWLIQPSFEYRPVSWWFTGVAFLVYAAIGCLIGGVAALALLGSARLRQVCERVPRDMVFRAVATASLGLACAIHLIVLRPFGLTVLVPLASLALGLTIALPVAIRLGAGVFLQRALTNPWAVSFALLGLPWLIKDVMPRSSTPGKALAAAGYLGLVGVIAILAERRLHARGGASRAGRLRPGFSVALALLALALSFPLVQAPRVASAAPPVAQQSPDHPSIVLISLDTVRADHLSPYGYARDTSPNLRRLAEDGVVYARAIAASDMTLSTHASMFTGLYPSYHGAHQRPTADLGAPLKPRYQTLAESLSEADYLTLAVIANHGYLSEPFGFAQGFHHFDTRAPTPFYGAGRDYLLRMSLRSVLSRVVSAPDDENPTKRAEQINTEVFSLLGPLAAAKRRVFLFVNYMDAHLPTSPLPPYDTLYPGKDATFTLAGYEALYDRILGMEAPITEAEHRHLISQYDGSIAYLDFHLGRLFAKLKELDLYDGSLIVVTSDHGEAFGEKDLIGHAVSVYQNQVHVPLIIKYPDNGARGVVHDLVSTIDIMPTILDVIGRPLPPGVQGQSLVGMPRRPERILFSETFPSRHLVSYHERFRRIERAVFFDPFKLIVSNTGKRELYHLAQDPDEQTNLYRTNRDRAIDLEQALVAWLKTAEATTSLPSELDPATIDRLKSLGYVR